ncbi:hypothetical protein RS030_6738 [Cryptosporidium xiaoi]|uniref:TPR repeat-containing protein n=1 Tax=Cryptosporidium xiaoi TaxID=659607 RepID=A0AAV9XUM0_9CRYT
MLYEELKIEDYIELCKEAGNYKQAIFWCDVGSSMESENNEENDYHSISDFVSYIVNEDHPPKLSGKKSIEYLLEMASMYLLDGKEVCVESVLKRIGTQELENNENYSHDENRNIKVGLAEDFDSYLLMDDNSNYDSNSLLSKKLFLESQYLYSIHKYEECLSLIESSIDLSNFDTFTSSSIHTMAADAFSSIGNIEYATMLYETALYESHYAIEALDYLLLLPYCSENTKYSLLNNILNSPINELDKSWLRNYIQPFILQSEKNNEGSHLFKSASPSLSPVKKREKRLLPTSPINVTTRISIDNPDKIAFRNNYISGEIENKKTHQDLITIERMTSGTHTGLGLKLVTMYMYKFLCYNNNSCAYLLGYNVWIKLFKDGYNSEQSSNNIDEFSRFSNQIFNDNYKTFKYSTSDFCEFINMFSLVIVCKLYSEVSICQSMPIAEMKEYMYLLESFIQILKHYGGEIETLKKGSIDGSLIFSSKLFNSKLYGKNSDEICCGVNFNGSNLGNDLIYENDGNNSSGNNSWYKKMFPCNVIVSSYFFVKGCFLFASAFNRMHSNEENTIQTMRSLLRTSMYFLKRSINFNYLLLPAYYLWGNIYSILGQWDDAIVILRRIIRLFPSTNLSITSATSLLLQRVQFERELRTNDLILQCIGWASKGLTINKDSPSIYNTLGICAYYEKKYDIAIGYFQKAFYYLSDENYNLEDISNKHNIVRYGDVCPNYNTSLFLFNHLPYIISVNLALSYLMGGHYENAVDCLLILFSSKKYFHKTIFEPTILQYIYIALGISYHLLGNFREAINYYELFLSLPIDDAILNEAELDSGIPDSFNLAKTPGSDVVQMLVTNERGKFISKVFIKNIAELYNSIIQIKT